MARYDAMGMLDAMKTLLITLLTTLVLTGACARNEPPAPVFNTSAAAQIPAPSPATRPSLLVTSAGVWVTPRPGETIYQVARRHRVPLRQLIQANRLRPPYRLAPGRRLLLPPPRIHVVQPGETIYRIARKYSLSIANLVRANAIQPPTYRIMVGQRLRLPDIGRDPARAPRPVVRPMVHPSARPMVRPVVHPSAHPSAQPNPDRLTLTPPTKPRREIAQPRRDINKPRWQVERLWEVERAPRPSSAAASGDIPAPPPRAGSFRWPLQGRVVAGFGPTKGGSFNDGINIRAPRGARVRAAENGVVAYVGNELPGYGNLLLIRHRGGWMTAYAHNDAILVRRGQTVRKGQSVARVGNTGNVRLPQLHFELRHGERPVNPRKHLKRNGRS